MPLMDLAATLMDAQNVAGNGTTTVSTNSYDLGNPGTDANGNSIVHDAGQSNLNVEARVTTAATGGTSAQLLITTSTTTDGTGPTGTEVIVARSEAVPVASLVAGFRFPPCRVPVGTTGRFLWTKVVTVGAVTVLNVTAGVVISPTA